MQVEHSGIVRFVLFQIYLLQLSIPICILHAYAIICGISQWWCINGVRVGGMDRAAVPRCKGLTTIQVLSWNGGWMHAGVTCIIRRFVNHWTFMAPFSSVTKLQYHPFRSYKPTVRRMGRLLHVIRWKGICVDVTVHQSSTYCMPNDAPAAAIYCPLKV